jgi:hypothetical protein
MHQQARGAYVLLKYEDRTVNVIYDDLRIEIREYAEGIQGHLNSG